MKSILLVEDDKSLGETLAERLTKEGYLVTWANTFQKAVQAAEKTKFDVTILDVGLPDGNGWDLGKKMRSMHSAPIIFVTALGSAEDRLRGYEIGAEEYIPKPFHLKELLLRVNHVLQNHVHDKVISHGDITIDLEKMVICLGQNNEHKLNKKETDVLKLLIERSPRAVSRDEMLNRIWGEDEFPTTRTVDNVILRLRTILGEKNSDAIRSVRGVGYQWVGFNG